MMTNKIWYFLFAMLIVTTSCGSDDDEEFIGNWTIRGDFNGARRYAASSFVIEDKAYIACGFKGGTSSGNRGECMDDLWEFNPASDSWTQKASLGEANARKSAVAFAANGKGYVTTGWNKNRDEFLKDTWEYNPTSNTWAQKANFGDGSGEDAPARMNAIGIGFNNKGYVGTGEDIDTNMKDFFEYDPVADKWTKKADVGGSKRTGALAFVVNNTIYVGLGTSNGQYMTDLRAFNPNTGGDGEWTEKARLYNALSDEDFDDDYNMQRAYGVAFVMNNLAYISLGTAGSLRSDTWEYEPVSDRWVQRTSFEGTARQEAVGFAVNNRGFIATGLSGATLFDDVWEFKPTEEKNDNDNIR